MKLFVIGAALLLFNAFTAYSQDNDSSGVKLDLLKAPSSPASNLLGIASSDIEKPSDVSAFMLSLLSASQSFAKLPGNYAIDIAPYWLMAKKQDYTTAGLNKKNTGDVFRQTFVLSTAIRNPDSLDKNLNAKSTYAGLGFKFSVLRGDYDENTKNALNRIALIQQKLNVMTLTEIKNFRESDPEMKRLLARRDKKVQELLAEGVKMDAIKNTNSYMVLEEAINALEDTWKSRQKSGGMKAYLDTLKKEAEKFIINRQGWSWDFAGGVSSEFVDKKFDHSRLFNAGFWTSFGYTGSKGGSLLGLVRFLHNPDQEFALTPTAKSQADISTLDAGGRYVYSNLTSRFNASVEAIYRSVLSSNTIDPSWRLVANFEYSIWANQKLTFSFGRDFNGTITKDGTLIAALNFLTGFGNKR